MNHEQFAKLKLSKLFHNKSSCVTHLVLNSTISFKALFLFAATVRNSAMTIPKLVGLLSIDATGKKIDQRIGPNPDIRP